MLYFLIILVCIKISHKCLYPLYKSSVLLRAVGQAVGQYSHLTNENGKEREKGGLSGKLMRESGAESSGDIIWYKSRLIPDCFLSFSLFHSDMTGNVSHCDNRFSSYSPSFFSISVQRKRSKVCFWFSISICCNFC